MLVMKNLFSFLLLASTMCFVLNTTNAQETRDGYDILRVVNGKVVTEKAKTDTAPKATPVASSTSTVVRVIPVDKSLSSDTPLINWMSWEEALEASKSDKKKVFVDVFTDWCGWCKKMDASTFVDPEVVAYMNENFHAVKLNAEQVEDIQFGDKTFKFVTNGRKGSHELAIELLNGRLAFPSFVLLNEDFARIRITPGFKQVPQLMSELTYAKDELYKLKTYDDFVFGF